MFLTLVASGSRGKEKWKEKKSWGMNSKKIKNCWKDWSREERKENISKKEMNSQLAYLFEIEMCQEFWQKPLYKLSLLRGSLGLPAVTLLTQLHQLTFPTVIPHSLPPHSQISWIWKKMQLRDGNQWEFGNGFYQWEKWREEFSRTDTLERWRRERTKAEETGTNK